MLDRERRGCGESHAAHQWQHRQVGHSVQCRGGEEKMMQCLVELEAEEEEEKREKRTRHADHLDARARSR